jgi:hypothetical protein
MKGSEMFYCTECQVKKQIPGLRDQVEATCSFCGLVLRCNSVPQEVYDGWIEERNQYLRGTFDAIF